MITTESRTIHSCIVGHIIGFALILQCSAKDKTLWDFYEAEKISWVVVTQPGVDETPNLFITEKKALGSLEEMLREWPKPSHAFGTWAVADPWMVIVGLDNGKYIQLAILHDGATDVLWGDIHRGNPLDPELGSHRRPNPRGGVKLREWIQRHRPRLTK